MTTLSEVVLYLVEDLPAEHIAHLADLLHAETRLDWGRLSQRMHTAIPQMEVQERVRSFIADWRSLPQPPSPAEMSALLQAVSAALAYQRQKQKVELIWTGPRDPRINLRRTDQALLELINSAQENLLIVSFAVYKIRAISAALQAAILRGVQVKIILEDPAESAGRISFSGAQAFGQSVLSGAKFYVWPLDKRPLSEDGKHGSLHAKVAVADSTHLFISSANLTEYAMDLNMEMGLLLTGGELPTQIHQHFEALIADKILVPAHS